MAFTQITSSDFTNKDVSSLPDKPTISSTALKARFDAPSKEVVAPAVNRLIGELEATSASASLGAVAPTGRTGATVQAVLNSVSTDLATAESTLTTVSDKAHTHSNKSVLDKFSDNGGAPYYDGNPIGGIYDYDSLTSRPSINSVMLTGNKSLSDLGIPTTLAAMSDDSTHRVVTDADKSAWNAKSTVSVTQVKTSGQKIAVVTVDGVGTDIYASTGGGGGGGSVNNAYKNVKVGSTTITASGEDTIEFIEGSNVTLTPNATNKTVTISASGGGQSTGDMLASDYDSDYSVKTAGGIKAYVNSQAYSLPTAGSSTLGGVKINGNNLSIDANGVLSAVDTTYSSKSESQGGTADSLVTTGEKYTWNHKQDALTFDDTPTSSSVNPVKSGGVYSALTGKIDDPTTKSDGQVLTYDNSNSVWKAVTPTVGATQWSELSNKPFSTVGNGLTVSSDALTADIKTVSVAGTGTASESATHKQQISVNGTAYDIDGTCYMEDSVKSTSGGIDTFDFTNAAIYTTSVIDVYADVFGVVPTDVTVTRSSSTGNVKVKFDSTDNVSKVRIYIR